MNALGLSTQIPAKYIYFTSGPDRTYDINGQTLEFRKKSSRETAMRLPESMLVVHALKTLGETYATPELIAKLKARYSPDQWRKIKSDTTTVNVPPSSFPVASLFRTECLNSCPVINKCSQI